jgi:hypothetical protein
MTGSAVEEWKGHAGRLSVRTPGRDEEARKILFRSQRKRLTKLPQQMGMSYSTARKIYRSYSSACPYKIHLSQWLTPSAKEHRLQFVMAFNALLEREPEVIGKI